MSDREYTNSLDGIKALLQSMAEKQNGIDEMVKGMHNTLTQLNQTVIGNSTYGQVGLVSEIAQIKEYVEKDKLLKNKLAGGLVIVGIVWTVILQYVGNIISFKK
jgi:hypothetical protein